MESTSPYKPSATPTKNPTPKSVVEPDIITPEKPIQLPRRARNRGVALSVKEVKRVALGLHRSPIDRSNASTSVPNLASVEEEFGATSSSKASSPAKVKPAVNLPEKYEMLCEFFNSMDSSIRLLRLKGSMTSFLNICTSIKHLTERRFTYRHLAQLKCIMPEAILIKKVLLRDEATCCMKPELQVNLQVEAVVDNKNESSSSALRKIFRERLVDFFNSHPQGDDVPEEQLPHPFNKERPNLVVNDPNRSSCSPTSAENSASSTNLQKDSVPSHLPGTFKKRFSARGSSSSLERTPLLCSSEARTQHGDSLSIALSPTKCTSRPPVPKRALRKLPAILPASSKVETSEATEMPERIDNDARGDVVVLDGTPAKQVSTPLRLMTATPDIATPKRQLTSDTCGSPLASKSLKRSTRTKLFMTPTKGTNAAEKECGSESLSDDDVLNILPESLLKSIKAKEKKAMQEKEDGVADAIKRQKLIASLPNIFNMILLIFQSWKRSVMTKNELIHKLISSNCKIVDRGEVEEQMKLLQELVPDWISEKVSYSGDILCSINKASSTEDVRRRLTEAK